jgi:hypothetical protein
MSILMNYVDIPVHQTHLQAKDGMFSTIIGKDKLDRITVSLLGVVTKSEVGQSAVWLLNTSLEDL